MTKRWLLGAGMLAVAATVYATTSGAAPHTWTVERYYTTETWHAFADVGKKDNGGPDDVYAAQRSLKRLDGSTVGIVNGYGVNLHPPYVFFHWTATLTDGSITLESAIDLKSKAAVYAIEGGTGRYAGAGGTVTFIDAGSKGTLAVVRYRQ